MSNDQKASSVATEKGYPTDMYPPKTCAISQSKVLHAERRVEDAAQAKSQKVIYMKVEDPQLASKNQDFSNVPSRRFVGTAAAPLCPRGVWKVLCCVFFLLCLVAVILFIIDIIHHK